MLCTINGPQVTAWRSECADGIVRFSGSEWTIVRVWTHLAPVSTSALVTLVSISSTPLSEVRSPVDGEVLTIRVHVIHSSEGTAVLRLLYRKESQADRR